MKDGEKKDLSLIQLSLFKKLNSSYLVLNQWLEAQQLKKLNLEWLLKNVRVRK